MGFITKLKNFLSRDWIHKEEGKLTYVQLFGFILITLGVVYFSSFLLPSGIINYFPILKLEDTPIPEGISIAFFTTMLGVSFAFPSMLEGQTKEISTMRIIIFMFSNVICMLLLKIGWNKNSLVEIGLDGYWMGIIAFLFGGKATQSYFESKMAVPGNNSNNNLVNNNGAITNKEAFNSVELIKLAIKQNNNLKATNFNIENMAVGSINIDGHHVHCVDIHLNDNNTKNLPPYLTVEIKNQDFLVVPINIIPNIGVAKTNIMNGDTITNQTANGIPGTLGCFLENPVNKRIYALSCCHVFTNDQWINYNGFNVPKSQVIYDTTANTIIGNWIFGLMNSHSDFAYTSVNNASEVTPSGLSNSRPVNDQDILHKTPVAFKGAINNNATAVISNYDCTRTIYYGSTPVELNNLILISHNNTSPSSPGDSGSLVYTTDTNEPIGLVVAADLVFSYIIPIETILSATKFNIY